MPSPIDAIAAGRPGAPGRPASGIVLAGGRSSRLGSDKAFLRLDSGQPIVEDILARLALLSDDLIIVANEPDRFDHLGVRIVGDVFPGAGSLGGLYSGLLAAQHQRGVVVACDMPFLNVDLLRYMLALPSVDSDIVVPRHGAGYLETLHAVYSRSCLGPIRYRLESGLFRISSFFEDVRVQYVEEPELRRLDPDLLSFFNVNTPSELQQAFELSRRLRPQ